MKHELWYSVVVRDRHGKVVSRERRRSKSFLKAWNQLVYVQMGQLASYAMKETGGVSKSVAKHQLNLRMIQAIGAATEGIIVGTGNTPVAIDDFALQTKIEQGTGAGQMEYQASTVALSVVAAPSCSFLVSRSIVNNSPGVITVREAAIYGVGSGFSFCVTRDVFVAEQAVPIGGSITIDWTLGVTV